jgi:hypothetical protein
MKAVLHHSGDGFASLIKKFLATDSLWEFSGLSGHKEADESISMRRMHDFSRGIRGFSPI